MTLLDTKPNHPDTLLHQRMFFNQINNIKSNFLFVSIPETEVKPLVETVCIGVVVENKIVLSKGKGRRLFQCESVEQIARLEI